MGRPTVRVIAFTKFLGVPEELRPEDPFGIGRAGQDQGSGLARLTECAGRTCYDSYSKGRDSGAYHAHILEVGHGSVLEHASISFYIAGVSRGCTHELVRHRSGCAISQRSTRYVDESESDWCWHPLLAAAQREMEDTSGDPRCEETQRNAQATYRRIVALIEAYLIRHGADNLTARKQARGAARGALGNALETALVWTANLRALRNVLEQRASEFADAEIRLLANALYEAALPIVPEYLGDYERVPCPDGIGYGLRTQFRKV